MTEQDPVDRVYIDADSPDQIDKLLVAHAYEERVNRIQHGSLLPTDDEQLQMLTGIWRREKGAINKLISGNRAMIGAVAYEYKEEGRDSRELVWIAANVLQRIAAGFDYSNYREFNDFAIRSMRHILSRKVGTRPERTGVRPTEEVERFLGSLVVRPPGRQAEAAAQPKPAPRPMPRPAPWRKQAQESGPIIIPDSETRYIVNEFEGIDFTGLTDDEKLVLFKITYSQVQIAKQTGLKLPQVSANVKSLKEKLKCANLLEVVFKVHHQGAFLESSESLRPLPDCLTEDEITVLESAMTYREIADKSHLDEGDISGLMAKALKKTGVRSRLELTVMLLDARRMHRDSL